MSFLKEVSQKCFVFELQSFIFEGSLAEKLRFWASKLQFWRKSRRKASFLNFKASILKEVSQKCFVFEFQSFIFEGSLAEKLRFWASKLQVWRKSRRNVSFLSFQASILKEVSQKSFVFELQSFNFEGSLAEMLRFWISKLHFWRKSRRKASFLSFKASSLKEVSQKSFVWQNHLNHSSADNQITWTSNHLTSKSFESQINWQPTHLNLKSVDNQISWISDQLTTESFESQINWQPHHLSSNQQTTEIIWSTLRLTTKPFESQINWQPKINWQPNQLNLKSTDNQNHLNLTSFESDINWLSNQLNSAHSLPIGSLSLETSATASCGRYVIMFYSKICLFIICCSFGWKWYTGGHRCSICVCTKCWKTVGAIDQRAPSAWHMATVEVTRNLSHQHR